MSDLLRETAFGQFIRLVSQSRLLQYPEELPGFEYKYPAAKNVDNSEGVLLRTASNPTNDLEKAEIDAAAGGSITPNSDDLDLKDTFTLVDWYSPGWQSSGPVSNKANMVTQTTQQIPRTGAPARRYWSLLRYG